MEEFLWWISYIFEGPPVSVIFYGKKTLQIKSNYEHVLQICSYQSLSSQFYSWEVFESLKNRSDFQAILLHISYSIIHLLWYAIINEHVHMHIYISIYLHTYIKLKAIKYGLFLFFTTLRTYNSACLLL